MIQQKTVGILSVGSLAIAVCVAVLIGLWAANEFSFDRFHKDGDRIYRAYASLMMNNAPSVIGSTYKKLGEDGVRKFPKISAMCRVVPQHMEIKIKEVMYLDNEVLEADSNFFSFFTFPLKAGNPQTCLSSPDGLVIDEYSAHRYFPGEDPLGKSLMIRGKNYTVTAVMKNMPENSHLKAHIVTPFLDYYAKDLGYGTIDSFITYFKIADAGAVSGLETKMSDLIHSTSPAWKQLRFEYKLQHLYDIHFNTSFNFDWGVVHGNKSLVILFIVTALVILLIACINFINLFISTSFLRANSIGVKKAYGAGKKRLMGEFYRETFYHTLFAVITGMTLTTFALPFFNRLAGYQLSIDFYNPGLYLFLGGILVFVLLVAGTFPALYMTKFNVVATLKGQFKGKNVSFLQKGLIIAQFTATIVLLITVFFIYRQVGYMIGKDLGFDKENVIYVYDRGGFVKGYETFRKEMMGSPSITDVTLKDTDPTRWGRGDAVFKPGDEQMYLMECCQIQPNYFDMMGMKMAGGKGFSEGQGDSLNYCIVNETAARVLGFADPVGEELRAEGGKKYIVRGIVKDAQTKSLHQKIDPQIYFVFRKAQTGNPAVLFKIQGNPQEAVQLIRDRWNRLNPGIPFDYHFLDETYAKMYKAETHAGQILSTAMGITLMISVAGLFAMAFYTTQRRMKEIGVRKVNGASVRELWLMLNRDFVVWVGISFLMACPIAYYLVLRWLENFTARVSLSWWVFALVGLILLTVTLLTVSYQTWKTATLNPIKVLKSE